MIRCPKCGAASKVIVSRHTASGSIRRRRKCLGCGERWSTLELLEARVAAAEKIMGAFSTIVTATTPAPPPAPTARSKKKKVQKRHGPPKRHGVVVPPHLEADWRTFKDAGYTDAEAAHALGLKLPEPTS